MGEPAPVIQINASESKSKPNSISSVTKKMEPWWATIVVALATCLITNYFSYRSARSEAEIRVEQAKVEADAKAQAGYAVLVKAVEKLQEHDEENAKTISELNAHIMAVEMVFTNLKVHRDENIDDAHLDLPKNGKWRPAFPPKTKMSEPREKTRLPATLDGAVQELDR